MSKATRDFYAMNLSDSQADKFIQKIEADIAAQLQILNMKEPPMRETEQLYLEMKAEVDQLTAELNENKGLLEAMSRFRNNISGSKEFRILRTTSNVDDKKVRNKREFKWLNMAAEVLEKTDRFMSVEELYTEILKANPQIAQNCGNDPKKMQIYKNALGHNFARACGLTRERKDGNLIDYRNKIGLFAWVLDDFTPEPKYIKPFMSAHAPVKNGAKIVAARPAHGKVQHKVMSRR